MTTWISIAIALPPIGKYVLVWRRYGREPNDAVCIGVRERIGDIAAGRDTRSDADEITWYFNNYTSSDRNGALAWMPLPPKFDPDTPPAQPSEPGKMEVGTPWAYEEALKMLSEETERLREQNVKGQTAIRTLSEIRRITR